MYVTTTGCPNGFFPINTKWGGTSSLSGILPGGGLRYFRPNFAMARGMYPGGGHSWNSMGQLEVDPTMLGLGIGALALGMFLFGSKHGPNLRKRKAARLRKKLRELEA